MEPHNRRASQGARAPEVILLSAGLVLAAVTLLLSASPARATTFRVDSRKDRAELVRIVDFPVKITFSGSGHYNLTGAEKETPGTGCQQSPPPDKSSWQEHSKFHWKVVYTVLVQPNKEPETGQAYRTALPTGKLSGRGTRAAQSPTNTDFNSGHCYKKPSHCNYKTHFSGEVNTDIFKTYLDLWRQDPKEVSQRRHDKHYALSMAFDPSENFDIAGTKTSGTAGCEREVGSGGWGGGGKSPYGRSDGTTGSGYLGDGVFLEDPFYSLGQETFSTPSILDYSPFETGFKINLALTPKGLKRHPVIYHVSSNHRTDYKQNTPGARFDCNLTTKVGSGESTYTAEIKPCLLSQIWTGTVTVKLARR